HMHMSPCAISLLGLSILPLCCQGAPAASSGSDRDSTAPPIACQGQFPGNFANLLNLDDLTPRCYIARRTRRTCRRSSEAEQGTHKPRVAGSNPAVGTIVI